MSIELNYLERIKKVLQTNEDKICLQNSRALFSQISVEYKHQLSGKFVLTNPEEIKNLDGKDFCITRKIDGEMRTVFFDGEKAVMYTTGGKEEKDFPCLKELSCKLKEAGVKTAGLAAELNYLKADGSRSRVTDTIHAIACPELHGNLALSPFDILLIDGKKWEAEHYKKTYEKLMELFGSACGRVKPVQMEEGKSAEDILRVYKKWVVKEKAEGLVVHSEGPFVWKIKPLHTIDAAAIGYTLGDKGVRDLLFAVIEPNGLYRIFASGGNGLTQEERKQLEYRLSLLKVDSNLIYTDSHGQAFQMIKPQFVFEVSAIDFATEKCFHEAYKNYIAEYSFEKGWLMKGRAAGVTTYSLSIIRLRDDKKSIKEDIAVHQISDICPFPASDNLLSPEDVPESKIISRMIFYKKNGKSSYIKKFILLKTNKEKTGLYPKYFLHFTDYSSSRKDKMKITIFCSSKKEELEEKRRELISKNVKAGWQKF